MRIFGCGINQFMNKIIIYYFLDLYRSCEIQNTPLHARDEFEKFQTWDKEQG